MAKKINNGFNGPSGTFDHADGYVSPEIIKNEPYSIEKNDVWQLGVFLYVLLFSTLPFKNAYETINLDILPNIIYSCWRSGRYEQHEEIDLLASMLSKNPSLRPSMDQILLFLNAKK